MAGGAAVRAEADAVSLLHAVEVPRRPVSLMEPVIGPARYEQLARACTAPKCRDQPDLRAAASSRSRSRGPVVLVDYAAELWVPITYATRRYS